jgi:hypothetical protein
VRRRAERAAARAEVQRDEWGRILLGNPVIADYVFQITEVPE